MIHLVKNIHNEELIYSGQTIPQDGTTEDLIFWTDDNYNIFVEHVTTGKLEVRTFDNSILPTEKVLEFANYKHRRVKSEGNYPLIYDLIHPFYYNHPFCCIVPEKMKLSGVILQEILTFDVRGFVVRKDYYFNYKNVNETGRLVYSKVNDYILSDLYPWPSSNALLERQRTEYFYNIDGTENEATKKYPKYYPDISQHNTEGEIRRKNKERRSGKNMALAMIYSGGATGEQDAEDKLIELTEYYNSAFTSWRKYGRGQIYDSIDNDTNFAWFDGVIQDTPETRALILEAIGLTVREYINNILKGLM